MSKRERRFQPIARAAAQAVSTVVSAYNREVLAGDAPPLSERARKAIALREARRLLTRVGRLPMHDHLAAVGLVAGAMLARLLELEDLRVEAQQRLLRRSSN